MKQWLIIFALWPALWLTPMRADDRLPNDCAVLATRAFENLKTAYWVKIFSFHIEIPDPNGAKTIVGHALVLWQPFPHSKVHAYDENGSLELSTHSNDLKDIMASLQEVLKYPLVDGHFWD